MIYDKQLHNTKSISLFREEKFKGIFHAYDLEGDEKLLKCKMPKWSRPYFEETKLDETVEAVYLKGYEMKDPSTKKTYLLPSSVKGIDGKYKPITSLFPIKIKNSVEVYHGKKVYHWVGADNIKSVAFPEDNSLDMDLLIDSWFDIGHSNPDDTFACKVALLASHFGGFSRIIGDKGFGKDGFANTLIGITGIGNNISKVSSDAKWIKLIDDKYTIFNEISGFGGERKEIFQNFVLGTGDENTPEYNHSTTGSEKTGNKRNIEKYSYSIIHNPPSYYMEKGQIPFEQMFQPAVFDRFIPIRCSGRVDSKNSFQDPTIDFYSVVSNGMDYYKKFIGKVVWLRNHGSVLPLRYSLDKYDLSYTGRDETSSRWMNTWIHFAQIVQMYADDKARKTGENAEELFYINMDKIYKCHVNAKNEIEELGLM